LIFVLFWSPFVYAPIARWTWNAEGWTKVHGALDFAGGAAVHVCAGATVAAHCVFHKWILPQLEVILEGLFGAQASSRDVESRYPKHPAPAPPPGTESEDGGPVHPDAFDEQSEAAPVLEPAANYTNVLLGTVLLWVGWFGFNGGSASGANVRAVSACVSTHLAACFGAVFNSFFGPTGMVWDYFDQKRSNPGNRGHRSAVNFRFSLGEFCNGAVMGLVAITPAAGFVPHWIAWLFGVVPCILALPGYLLSEMIDDEQNVVVIHGLTGFVGMFMTGIFAKGSVAALDGSSSGAPSENGGCIDGYPQRLG
jgi:ammonium transporter, Amt family